MLIAESVVGISVNEKVKRNSTVLKNPSNTLAEIFKQSILFGIYPAKFKLTKIVPVFKNDALPDNYRPI